MPAGIGYGAVGRAFGSLNRGLLRYASAAKTVGAPGAGLASRLAGLSTNEKLALGGAVLGGTWGAFSDDTSVMGGALMGAGLGAGYGAAGKGLLRYNKMRAMGVGRGAAASGAFRMLGEESKTYFGSAYNRAINALPSTLKAKIPRYG